jgi:hypothetical protein
MTSLVMSIVVLFSGADGKLAETAAKETAWYLGRLWSAEVRCVRDGRSADARNANVVVAIGRAAEAFDSKLPGLAKDELHVRVREEGRRWAVLLRGGSPAATRAAAMRFLEQRGVLFGPLQDFMPDQAAEPKLAATEIRERPRRPLFGPHYWLNFPMDPSSFTREDWTRLVRGWSRMRATVMGYHFYQSFPWYDVEMRGFKDQAGYFFYGQRHPLAPEPELRYAIRNRGVFVPGEVEAFAEDGARVHAWAQETMCQAMALAHKLGMKNSLTMEPFGYAIPATYQDKMKEWNGGRAVDPKDRFHPLLREYVVCAIRSILQTYPDLDILKLVSGESARREGTAPELKAYITELVGGKLEDSQGRPVTLPEDVRALGTLADALTSCKLASDALAEARRLGLLRPGLEVAVGAYPGSDLKIHAALFSLAGRVAADPSIKLHFLPAHGMARSAQAMQLATEGVFSGRKLEISGWTEFDGMMYVPQSCVKAIHAMNQTLEKMPAEALYAIQWRVASTTFDNAYFTRSQWDAALTPERFWSDLGTLFGKTGSGRLREGMELLESNSGMGYAFCYLGTWSGLLPEELKGRKPGSTAGPEEKKEFFGRVRELVAAAGEDAPSRDGRRLAEYFTNKLECARIHSDYWREAVTASAQSREIVRSHAAAMLGFVRQYLTHYQKVMLDRTDEGMLASYWIAAGQYAYRYAYPERYKEAGIFQVGPAGAKVYWTGQPEEIVVQATGH